MQREIKFRVWDKRVKRMYWPRSIEFTPGGGTWSVGENIFKEGKFVKAMHNLPQNNDGSVLMQYTGIKDKNGVEIYEGDIVQWYKEGVKVVRDMIDYVSDYNKYTESDYLTTEVIGNIYENPELLEKK